MMKGIIYIAMAVAALLLCSCEKEHTSSVQHNEWPIFYGYMQFKTDVPKDLVTRADLATDMHEKSFGVLGYQYATTTNWATAKALAKPNVFYNQEVACDANGVCTYDIDVNETGNQLKPWEDYLYTFFAYQPYGGRGITLSSSESTNTPMLTYTYGWLSSVGANDPILAYNVDAYPIFDLMTAEAIDVNGNGSGAVNFEFKHRLFGLEILANNYNENVYQVDENGDYVTDADGNKIIETSARQTISNLKLTLSGLQHTTINIPLSMQSGEELDEEAKYPESDATIEEVTFKISDTEVIIPAFNETIDGRGEGIASSISQLGSTNGGYLMLIPQGEGSLDGTFTWDELADFAAEDVNTSFHSSIAFEAGKLYQVIINFVGSGITIAIIEAGNWDQQYVYHTFE